MKMMMRTMMTTTMKMKMMMMMEMETMMMMDMMKMVTKMLQMTMRAAHLNAGALGFCCLCHLRRLPPLPPPPPPPPPLPPNDDSAVSASHLSPLPELTSPPKILRVPVVRPPLCRRRVQATKSVKLLKQASIDGGTPVVQVHVRGIGVDGWDGTEVGTGAYESEEALRTIFSKYGKMKTATIRHRIQDGENTSWALVGIEGAEAADAILAEPAGAIMAGSNPRVQTQHAAAAANPPMPRRRSQNTRF